MANVANLVVQISADAKKLTSELKSAESQVQSFASKATGQFKLIGAVIGTLATVTGVALIRSLNETTKALDDLGDSAQAIGLTTQQLQKLQYQAGQAGSSAEGVTQAFTFMLNAIADAERGSEQQVEAFKRLGLEASQLKQLKPEEQFNKIAGAFQNIKNKADQVDISRTIFGRAGVDQINLLNSSLKETGERFARLGLGINESQAEAVDKLDKSRKTLDAIWDDFGNKLAADVAPGFDAIISGINDTVEHFGGAGEGAAIMADTIIGAIDLVVTAAEGMAKTWKALGIVKQGVILAGQEIGIGIAKTVRGENPFVRNDIQREITDPTVGKIQGGIENFDNVDKTSKVDVLVSNMRKRMDAIKKTGDTAEEAKTKVDKFADALNTVAKKADTKKDGATDKLSDSELWMKDQGAYYERKYAEMDATIQEMRDLRTKFPGTPYSKKMIGMNKGVGEFGETSYTGLYEEGGAGYGSIRNSEGKFSGINAQQNVVVTVVLVPDEGRLFNAVIDSQVFKRAVIETSNNNLLNVTRSDRS